MNETSTPRKAVLKAGMKEEDIVEVVEGRGKLAEAEGSWHRYDLCGHDLPGNR